MTKTESLGYLETNVDIDPGHMILGDDCVGQEIPFEFHKRLYTLNFPFFDFSTLDGFGHPKATHKGTQVALSWIERDHYQYGRESARRGNEVLEFSCSSFIVRSRKPVSRQRALTMRRYLQAWQGNFTHWLEAVHFLNLEGTSTDVSHAPGLEAYFLQDKSNKRLKPDSGSIVIRVNKGYVLTRRDIENAVKLCKDGSLPPSYYIMLVDALKAWDMKEYRQSVLSAATAFEMTLTFLLDAELKSLNTAQKTLLTRKYRGIAGLCNALRGLGVSLPPESEIAAKIGDPRNHAVHQGADVNHTQAKDALKFVQAFIYARLPL